MPSLRQPGLLGKKLEKLDWRAVVTVPRKLIFGHNPIARHECVTNTASTLGNDGARTPEGRRKSCRSTFLNSSILEIRHSIEFALEDAWQELRKETLADPVSGRERLATAIVALAAIGETDPIMLKSFALHAARAA